MPKKRKKVAKSPPVFNIDTGGYDYPTDTEKETLEGWNKRKNLGGGWIAKGTYQQRKKKT